MSSTSSELSSPSASPAVSNASDNVKVCCRFRPLSMNERAEGHGECIRFHNVDTVECLLKDEEVSHSFTFTNVFRPDCTQKQVYDEVGAAIVKDILQGYNGTIFVYGQTGSGKTHTMMGAPHHSLLGGTAPPPSHQQSGSATSVSQYRDATLSVPANATFKFGTPEEGIVPRAVRDLFQRMVSAPSSMEFEVRMHFVEIYMEHVKDLLDPSKTNLNVREDPATSSFYVEGCLQPYVSSPEEVMFQITKGLENRTTAATRMNEVSSRSHCLLGLHVKSHDSVRGEQKMGKLFLVDLAGSEKVFKTGAVGVQLEEAKLINKSLTTLGLVINNLTDKHSKHIPYRDSKLTKILQDSLGGNSRTALVICCSPSSYNDQETLSTLRFGQRAKNIKNRAVINKEYTLEELKALLEHAESEIARLRAGGAVAPDMDALKLSAKLDEREKYFTARTRELEEEIDELRAQLQGSHDAVTRQNALLASYEEEVAAWQQEYSMLNGEALALERSLAMERKQKQAVTECFEAFAKNITTSTKKELEAIRVLCVEAMDEVTEAITRTSTQKEAAEMQGNERVTALEQRLTFAQEEYAKLEESWKAALEDLGTMQWDLEILQKQLGIRNERVENLKRGLRQERATSQEIEARALHDRDALMAQILEARSDAELWRQRFESLSSVSNARAQSRIVKHVRGLNSGTM